MDSIAPECTELKLAYESCFNSWYEEKFLKGKKDNDCKPLFLKYRNCLERTLKEKNIDVLLEEHDKFVGSDFGFDADADGKYKSYTNKKDVVGGSGVDDNNNSSSNSSSNNSIQQMTTSATKKPSQQRPFLWGLFT